MPAVALPPGVCAWLQCVSNLRSSPSSRPLSDSESSDPAASSAADAGQAVAAEPEDPAACVLACVHCDDTVPPPSSVLLWASMASGTKAKLLAAPIAYEGIHVLRRVFRGAAATAPSAPAAAAASVERPAGVAAPSAPAAALGDGASATRAAAPPLSSARDEELPQSTASASSLNRAWTAVVRSFQVLTAVNYGGGERAAAATPAVAAAAPAAAAAPGALDEGSDAASAQAASAAELARQVELAYDARAARRKERLVLQHEA